MLDSGASEVFAQGTLLASSMKGLKQVVGAMRASDGLDQSEPKAEPATISGPRFAPANCVERDPATGQNRLLVPTPDQALLPQLAQTLALWLKG